MVKTGDICAHFWGKIGVLLTYSNILCGEGNGTPLQYSCLENPMDRGAWCSVVHGVAKSQTQLSNFSFTFHLEKEMHWRRKWQPTPVFLPGESQGQGAWWAAIYVVTQSQTRLNWLSSSNILYKDCFAYFSKNFTYVWKDFVETLNLSWEQNKEHSVNSSTWDLHLFLNCPKEFGMTLWKYNSMGYYGYNFISLKRIFNTHTVVKEVFKLHFEEPKLIWGTTKVQSEVKGFCLCFT